MTHEERLALIHRPFFIRNLGPCYPHGGTAVTDTFFSDPDDPLPNWAERARPDEAPGSGDRGWPVRFKTVLRAHESRVGHVWRRLSE